MSRKASVRLTDAVNAYLADRQADGLSPLTIKSVKSLLDAFCRNVGNVWLSQVSPVDVRDFFRGLDVAGSTHNKYIKYVTTFVRWATREGYINGSLHKPELMSRVVAKKIEEEPEKLWLSAEQAVALVATGRDARDRALLTVALDTASRAGELRRMKIGDLDLDAGSLRKVITKSRTYSQKVDLFPVTDESETELRRWLAAYAQSLDITLPVLMSRTDWYLFPRRKRVSTRPGKPDAELRWVYLPTLPTMAPWDITKFGLMELGFTEAEVRTYGGVHCTRRTAVRLANDSEGGDIRLAQALAGHESQRTTEVYLGISRDRERRDTMLRAGTWRKPAETPRNVVPLTAVGGK